MRFLVTGGAGFLGAALANRLAADGHSVAVLDDLSQGDSARLPDTVDFTQGDVRNIPLLWSLLREVDCVYHLAARVSVAESVLHPQAYNEVNVGGTVSLMEAMRDTGVTRVIFTSSGAVYGRLPTQPVRETEPPNPDSPYAVSKWSAEQYVHTIGRLWNMETVALRIFNAYGPQQGLPVSHAPVIPRFLHQALTGGSIVVYGSGRQTRDYVYVSDVIDALVSAATVKAVNRQVINIGSGTETSLLELVDTIEALVGKRVNQLQNAQKGEGVPRLVADISQAKELLGFRPAVSLKEGLERILREDGRFQSLST